MCTKSVSYKCCPCTVGNSERLPNPTPPDDETPVRSTRQARDKQRVFDKDCIFCGVVGVKMFYTGGIRVKQDTSGFEYGGGDQVIKAAEHKGDEKLLIRIRGKDLFACEAKYHRKCRKTYCNILYRGSEVNKKTQSDMASAHAQAYEKVTDYIAREIIRGGWCLQGWVRNQTQEGDRTFAEIYADWQQRHGRVAGA